MLTFLSSFSTRHRSHQANAGVIQTHARLSPLLHVAQTTDVQDEDQYGESGGAPVVRQT